MRKFWVGTMAVALLLSLAWGINEYRLAGNYRLALDNQNQSSLQGFASYLDQVDTNMAKSGVAATPNQQLLYLGRVSNQSEAANQDLAQLPSDPMGLSYTGQLLTQTADFANSLSQRIAGGGSISAADAKTLNDMHTRVIEVNRKVQNLALQTNTENLPWTGAPAKFSLSWLWGKTQVAEASAGGPGGTVPSSVQGGFEQLDASLEKLPPFNYQGEFSTRSVERPLGLPAGEVSREQAQSVAADFLAKAGYPSAAPVAAGEIKGGFAGYAFTDKTAYVDVSRQGGVVQLFHDQRMIQPRKLSVAAAKEKAAAVLKSMHLNLTFTSVQDEGSYIQLEAVSEENGILYYLDKVRLMVAMDNGQLVGYDATSYWAFHHVRNFPGRRITLQEAESKLHSGFSITSSQLVVIPKVGNQEILCYEFRGRYQGEGYLVYINALNGREEKIQRIIQTPWGEYAQ